MRRALEPFNQFFVQNTRSKELLQSIGFENIHISGDTRFDRVGKILSTNASLDFMEQFKGQQLCIVSGSTWPEDEEILVDFINASSKNTKFVIAPHDIKPKHIQKLKSLIDKIGCSLPAKLSFRNIPIASTCTWSIFPVYQTKTALIRLSSSTRKCQVSLIAFNAVRLVFVSVY